MNTIKYLYLGFALAVFGHLYLDNWRFWAILIPLAIMDSYIEQKYKKE